MVKTYIQYCIIIHISKCILLGDERDDHEDTADTTNQSVTSVPVYEPPQATQKRSHTSEEDSEVPIVEPTEYKMPPIDKAKFELTVVKAPFIQQLHELTDPTAVETKVSDSLLPNHGTSPLSLVSMIISVLIHNWQFYYFLQGCLTK